MTDDGQGQPSNVVHEQPTSKIRNALDQILHFWPLLTFIGVIGFTALSTLGQVYFGNIAEAKYVEMKTSDPVIQGIKGDINTIKNSINNLSGNDTEIRDSLSTIEGRLDTLIRIQLERAQSGG